MSKNRDARLTIVVAGKAYHNIRAECADAFRRRIQDLHGRRLRAPRKSLTASHMAVYDKNR